MDIEEKKRKRHEYYENNKEKWRSKESTEESREYHREYYRRNKDKWKKSKELQTEEQAANRLSTVRKLKKKYGHEHKATLILLKGGKCSKCGIEYTGENGACFDFHHTNPEEKDFNITTYLRYYSKIPDKIIKEIDKCELVCSNCHRLIHSDKY